MERNSSQDPRRESEKTRFFSVNLCDFEKKKVHVVIDRCFSLFLKGSEGFS